MEVQNQNISTKGDSPNNLSRATFGAASASFLGNACLIGARVPDAIERGAYIESTGLAAGVTVTAVASTVFLVRAIKARKG